MIRGTIMRISAVAGLFLGAAILFSCAGNAAPCVLPFTLISGTVASATQVMGNFNTLVNCFAPIDLSAQTIAQTIVDRPGSTTSPVQPYNSSVAAQRWELAMGSQASPITTGGPALRMTMATAYSTATITNSCNNAPAQVACVTTAIFVNQGLASSKGSSIGVAGVASHVGALGAGTNDTIGVVGVGEVLIGGIGIGFGGYFQGQRDNVNALAIGIEPTVLNSTGVDCIALPYNQIGQCDSIWATSRGSGPGVNLVSSALHIGPGDLFSWFAEGITLNNGSVKNFSFNDQSGSSTSIRIDGTHTVALGSSSGDFGLGIVAPLARLHLAGGKSKSFWGGSGIGISVDSASYTDTSSAGATGGIAAHGIAPPTFVASAASTYSSGSTFYIGGCPNSGANVTLTACYGLAVNATIQAVAYAVGSTAGVTCGAGLGASTRTINGLVTTC